MDLSDCTESISRSSLSSASGIDGCLQAKQVPDTGSSDLHFGYVIGEHAFHMTAVLMSY